MARHEEPVPEGPLGDFAEGLRELRRRMGSPPPTYRVLAKRAGMASSALSSAASGRRLPSLAVLRAYVRVCGGDVADWEWRWQEMRAALDDAAGTGGRVLAEQRCDQPPELLEKPSEAAVDLPKPAEHAPDAGELAAAVARERPEARWLHGKRRRLLPAAAVVVLAVGVLAAASWPGSSQRTATGMLALSRELPPAEVDLAATGKADWVHWGFLESDKAVTGQFAGNHVSVVCRYNLHCSNRKRGVNQISDYEPIGNVAPFRLYNRDSTVTFSWSGGAPTAAATAVRSGEYMGLRGNGFRFSVPADHSTRTFVLYAGTYQGKVSCRAVLSDDSAAPIQDTSFDTFGTFNTGKYTMYVISYRAGSGGQKLTVELTLSEDIGGGNVTLFAAALR